MQNWEINHAGLLKAGCGVTLFFFFSSSQNRDIVENWQWQEGSWATTRSTPVLNSSSVPRVVAIRWEWPAWLTFKVNCLISSTYYIIAANAAHQCAWETAVRWAETREESFWWTVWRVHTLFLFVLRAARSERKGKEAGHAKWWEIFIWAFNNVS